MNGPGSGNAQQETVGVGFAWFEGGALLNNVYGHTNSERWAQVKDNYEQYAIKGMSL